MAVTTKTLNLHTCTGRPSYHNITEELKAFVKESGIQNGICVVQTPHTTCSVFFEEFVHDLDFNGDEFLQVDFNRLLDQMVPRELSEDSNYRYPGKKHLDFLMGLNDPNYPCDPGTILNGDAHIRGTLVGASETFIVKDGVPQIGSVGYVYFVDWDQNRERERKCHLLVMGE